MGKVLIHGNRWKKEKGLTLIEMVVSLAIIVIVSVAAFSVAVYSSNAQKRIALSRYMTVLVDNSLELYESYEGSAFNTAFNKLTGQEISYGTSRTYCLNKDYVYVNESEAAYFVKYAFKTSSLTVTASYEDGDVIYERSASK